MNWWVEFTLKLHYLSLYWIKKKIELIIYYPKNQNIAVKAQQLKITFSVNRQKNPQTIKPNQHTYK